MWVQKTCMWAAFTLNEFVARKKKVGGQFKVREGIVFRANRTVLKIANEITWLGQESVLGSSH